MSVHFFNPVLIVAARPDEKGKSDPKGLSFGQHLVNLSESLFACGTGYAVNTTEMGERKKAVLKCRVEPLSLGRKVAQVAALVTLVISSILTSIFYLPALALLSIPATLFLVKIIHHQKIFEPLRATTPPTTPKPQKPTTPEVPTTFEVPTTLEAPATPQVEESNSKVSSAEDQTDSDRVVDGGTSVEIIDGQTSPAQELVVTSEEAAQVDGSQMQSAENVINEKLLERVRFAEVSVDNQIRDLNSFACYAGILDSYDILKGICEHQSKLVVTSGKLDKFLKVLQQKGESADAECAKILHLIESVQEGGSLTAEIKAEYFNNLSKRLQSDLETSIEFPALNSPETLMELKNQYTQICRIKNGLLDFVLDEENLLPEKISDMVGIVYDQFDGRLQAMTEYVGLQRDNLCVIVQEILLTIRELRIQNEGLADPMIPIKAFQHIALLRFMDHHFSFQFQADGQNLDYHQEIEEMGKLMNLITPVGLENPGQSCYMNSCVQLFMNISYFKQRLRDSIDRIEEPEYIDDIPFIEALAGIVVESDEIRSSPQSIWDRLRHLPFGQSDKGFVSKDKLNILRTALYKANLLVGGEKKQNDSAEILLRLLDAAKIKVDIKTLRQAESEETGMQKSEKIESELMITIEVDSGNNQISFSDSMVNHFSPKQQNDHWRKVLEDGREHTFNSYQESYQIAGEPPPVLVVHLKRFQVQRDEDGKIIFDHNRKPIIKKIQTPVVFDPNFEIDLSPFCASHSNNPVQANYRLVAVNIHKGEMGGGHYYDIIRKGDVWFECNDKTITPIDTVEDAIQSGYIFVLERVDG